MCHTIHCFMRMQGHGKSVDSMNDLLSMLLAAHGTNERAKPETQEEWLEMMKEDAEARGRAAEISLSILNKTPPLAEAKLVGLEVLVPYEPKRHGVLTIATYVLESGAFQVVGTDHLTQFTINHTTPNKHGLEGLIDATRVEVCKQSQEMTEAKEATQH